MCIDTRSCRRLRLCAPVSSTFSSCWRARTTATDAANPFRLWRVHRPAPISLSPLRNDTDHRLTCARFLATERACVRACRLRARCVHNWITRRFVPWRESFSSRSHCHDHVLAMIIFGLYIYIDVYMFWVWRKTSERIVRSFDMDCNWCARCVDWIICDMCVCACVWMSSRTAWDAWQKHCLMLNMCVFFRRISPRLNSICCLQ